MIKAGGELIGDGRIRKRIIGDLARLRAKSKLVFVHGGGPQIEKHLLQNHIPVRFVHGRRVTTPAAMEIVEQVLSGSINKSFAAELSAKGPAAVGLSCRDARTMIGRPIPGLGRAARPERVNTFLLNALLNNGMVPILSSVGSDSKGRAVNINADDAASAIAKACKADHLVFLTNVSGVLDDRKKRIPVLHVSEIDALIRHGVIKSGMIPKVQSARAAIRSGVSEVNIVNGLNGIAIDQGTKIIA